MNKKNPIAQRRLWRDSLQILQRLERNLELPMVVLGFVWLGLLIVDLLGRLNRLGDLLGQIIYVVFVLDFALRFLLAPRKWRYIRRNWLTALTLLLPALRVFRAARALRLLSRARSLSLVRLLGSLNRGMAALGRSMSRRGVGYIFFFTVIVLFVGAAGMLYFEREVPGSKLTDYGSAVWWTLMLLTTIGSEYWPQTAEARFLCVLLSLYALAVFTYLTGAIATFFIGRDAEDEAAELAGAEQIRRLEQKIDALQAALDRLNRQAEAGFPPESRP